MLRKSRWHTYGTPEYEIGTFGWGTSLKQIKYEKCDTKNAENESGAPWRMKRKSN